MGMKEEVIPRKDTPITMPSTICIQYVDKMDETTGKIVKID